MLSFLGLLLIGTLLLALPGMSRENLPWIDLLFTATSAVCVTGLAVFDPGSVLTPHGQARSRSPKASSGRTSARPNSGGSSAYRSSSSTPGGSARRAYWPIPTAPSPRGTRFWSSGKMWPSTGCSRATISSVLGA